MSGRASTTRAANDASVRELLLDELRRAIQRCPDMRVCQIIVNATGGDDPFYVEDWTLIKAIRSYPRVADRPGQSEDSA